MLIWDYGITLILLCSYIRTQQVYRLHHVAQMRDNYAPAHNQRDIERVGQLLVCPTGIYALDQVVIDTVIATQEGGSN